MKKLYTYPGFQNGDQFIIASDINRCFMIAPMVDNKEKLKWNHEMQKCFFFLKRKWIKTKIKYALTSLFIGWCLRKEYLILRFQTWSLIINNRKWRTTCIVIFDTELNTRAWKKKKTPNNYSFRDAFFAIILWGRLESLPELNLIRL